MSQLWKFSDSIGEKLRDMQPYLAFDVGIPLKSIQAFIETDSARLSQAYPGATNLLFGHLGDGNLHLSTGPHAAADLVIVEEMVYNEVRRVGGSISAEHGIGRIKKPFLKYSRNQHERALMQQIKCTLHDDPRLNRHRVLDV